MGSALLHVLVCNPLMPLLVCIPHLLCRTCTNLQAGWQTLFESLVAKFLGAVMSEVFRNLFISHVVDEHNFLVSEELIGLPLETLGDSLGISAAK